MNFYNMFKMKISKSKFVGIFVISALAFQLISNSFLSDEPGIFPIKNEWYPGLNTGETWKSSIAKIIHPLKIILVGPPSLIFNDPDPVPPILLFGFCMYWATLAILIYYLITLFQRKTLKA
ncbi:MAG: hypothetical protein IPL23_07730 [Saprospiraceae bacterium]|nr:hypothetical protein [Saprospiraceae bacterium]